MKDAYIRDNKYRPSGIIAALAAIVVVGLIAVACKPKDDAQSSSQAEQTDQQQADRSTEQPSEPGQQEVSDQADGPTEQPVGRLPGMRRRRRPGRGLELGQEAPLFDLPLFVLKQADDGELTPGLSDETVALSSFRGQQVVCVFFSSYT